MNADSEQDALLAAIFSSPAEDTPRLVYADWLDEHGEGEYAEFIRLQIEQTKHREPGPRKPLERRERQVWKLLKRKWRDLFEPPVVIRKDHFRRGFAFGVAEDFADMPVETFVKLSDRLWPRVPLQNVRVKCSGPIPDAFFESSYLRRLTQFWVTSSCYGQMLHEESAVRLFSCDPFDRLVSLRVDSVTLSQPVVDAIPAAPYVGRFEFKVIYLMRSDGAWGEMNSFFFPRGEDFAAEKFAKQLPSPEKFLIVPPGETSRDNILAHTRTVRP